MSSPAQGGPSVPKDKEKSVGSRMLTRMKTIVKKAEKRMSISGRSRAGPSTEAAVTSEPAPAESSKQAAAAAAAAPAVDDSQYTRVPKTQLHEERARRLGERFGLEIKPYEWHSTEGDALRVEKAIRMRVHHTCHSCKTNFGAAKECPSCQHRRCKECPRYPPRRTEAEKVASRERRAALLKERQANPPILADWDLSEKPVVLRRPAKSGGQDLIYKKPRQRVRRNCCQCDKLFARKSKTCDDCSHRRCTDCRRDPAKPSHYPYGYPGDEFGAKSTPHHECHECRTIFPADSADGTVCGNCSHPKCNECQRLTPRRVEPEPDPDILRSLETRLAALNVG